MKAMSKLSLALLAAAPLVLAGCGGVGGNPSTPSAPAGKGTFQAMMSAQVSAASLDAQDVDPLAKPKPDLSQIKSLIFNIGSVELVGQGSRVAMEPNPALGDADGDGNPEIDLMNLPAGGVSLVKELVPAGNYRQFRMFAAGADAVYLVMKNGSKQILRIPSGPQTGLKIVLEAGLKVNLDATTTLRLAFDLKHSLVVTGKGKYMLKPVVKASGDVTSGRVVGTVTLPGGQGVAATVQAGNADTSVSPITAGADGKYAYPAVPAPAIYDFVFSYTTPERVFYTATRPGVSVAANAETVVDAQFSPTGGITGTVTYKVGAADAPAPAVNVEIRKANEVGAPMIVSTITPGGQYIFDSLAPGLYDLSVTASLGDPAANYAATAEDVEVVDGVMKVEDIALTEVP